MAPETLVSALTAKLVRSLFICTHYYACPVCETEKLRKWVSC